VLDDTLAEQNVNNQFPARIYCPYFPDSWIFGYVI